MSKQGKRKITVELPKVKDLGNRPSVFERLGIKKSASVNKTCDFCRQWAQNGACAYGKTCKFANTHTLISPSKQRAANKDPTDLKKGGKDDNKNRLHSTVVVRSGRSPGGEMENWDQNDLEYADTDVLEKRRKQLQRELEIQLKMDSTKDTRKEKKKTVVSSSSSRSSSSSSVSSSSSDGSSSSSSTRESRKKGKKGKLKRNSSSSPEINLKKKQLKSDPKRDKLILTKKVGLKKDDIRTIKKHEIDIIKKKSLGKPIINKKSLSPVKKSGGTPPIIQKQMPKGYALHRNISKSPYRKDKIRSVSRHSSKDKDRDKTKDRDREKERDKDTRDKERFRRSKSPKPRARSKSSQRRHSSHSKDARSSERNQAASTPKSKQIRKDISGERHRKPSLDRKQDKSRDHKPIIPRKDKLDIDKERFDKERKDRLDVARNQERLRDRKRDQDLKGTRGRERDRGLNKGLKKPTKPTERLLPRPEERLAALAAISNKTIEPDKVNQPKERSENHDRSRKPDRSDRTNKRIPERHLSVERDHGDYDRAVDRPYDRPHSLERNYNRTNDRYDNIPHEGGNHSPSYSQNRDRDRHYDATYEVPPSHGRGYADPQDLPYEDHMEDHRNLEIGFDDRHGIHDHGWDGRDLPHDSDRPYPHIQASHKEWEEEGYRGDVYVQDRHWQHREPQGRDWVDKDRDLDSQWHGHRQTGNASGSRRVHDEAYMRGSRDGMPQQQHGSQPQKRNTSNQRPHETDNQTSKRQCLNAVPPPTSQTADVEDVAIPDDLSEISDDPDDILNRDDVIEQTPDGDEAESTACDSLPHDDAAAQKEIAPSSTAGPVEKKVELTTEQSEADDGLDSLDFEEISDGELEEDQKIKGLGDALGVDWASLVAEVRKDKEVAKGQLSKQSNTSARTHWQPTRVLARIGVSIRMAGEEMLKEIIDDYNKETKSDNGDTREEQIFNLHPVASIQVGLAKRARERASLVGAVAGGAGAAGGAGGRALSARRDLALRRRLCHLPPACAAAATATAPPLDARLRQRAARLLRAA